MDTMLDSPAGHAAGALPSAKRGPSVHKNRPSVLYRRIMHSWLMQPYRRLLHPLWVWTWKPHVSFLSNEAPTEKVYVNLKPPSTFVLVMSILLGPLFFVIFLPLIIITLPVAVFLGLLGVMIASMQTEKEEPIHHSLAWHVME